MKSFLSVLASQRLVAIYIALAAVVVFATAKDSRAACGDYLMPLGDHAMANVDHGMGANSGPFPGGTEVDGAYRSEREPTHQRSGCGQAPHDDQTVVAPPRIDRRVNPVFADGGDSLEHPLPMMVDYLVVDSVLGRQVSVSGPFRPPRTTPRL
jgi:hypothetical protein